MRSDNGFILLDTLICLFLVVLIADMTLSIKLLENSVYYETKSE